MREGFLQPPRPTELGLHQPLAAANYNLPGGMGMCYVHVPGALVDARSHYHTFAMRRGTAFCW